MNSRASLTERILWTLALGALFFVTYGYANYFSSQLEGVPSFYFGWETSIPFVPWMIIPYMSSDLIFVIAFLICREKSELRTLAKQIVFLTLFSVLVYFVMPLKFSFEKPEVNHFFLKPFFGVLSLDQPFNQLPSLHISFGLVFWIHLRKYLKSFGAFLLDIWFLLIAISTLTVFQHHFVDIPGGVIAAVIAMGMFPLESMPRSLTWSSSRIEAGYQAITFLAIAGFFGADGNWQIFMLYLAISFLSICFVYRFRVFGFLRKRRGKIPLLSYLMFFPFLLLVRVNWIYHKRKERESICKVSDDLYVGSRPYTAQLRQADFHPTTVVDLAPEIPEVPDLQLGNYLHCPILDLSVPTPNELKGIVDQIKTKARHPAEKIYIHCALGLSRSIVVAIALLMDRGMRLTDAKKQVIASRPESILTEEAMSLLKRFEKSLSYRSL